VISSTRDITTVAGNGTVGYSGDGYPATSFELYYPNGVAIDSSGNLYIADQSNNRIRKVTASTGYISTVAEKPPSPTNTVKDFLHYSPAEICFISGQNML
jgi:hypothetical protein